MSERDPWPILGDENRFWRAMALLCWFATWCAVVAIGWNLAKLTAVMEAILELSR